MAVSHSAARVGWSQARRVAPTVMTASSPKSISSLTSRERSTSTGDAVTASAAQTAASDRVFAGRKERAGDDRASSPQAVEYALQNGGRFEVPRQIVDTQAARIVGSDRRDNRVENGRTIGWRGVGSEPLVAHVEAWRVQGRRPAAAIE